MSKEEKSSRALVVDGLRFTLNNSWYDGMVVYVRDSNSYGHVSLTRYPKGSWVAESRSKRTKYFATPEKALASLREKLWATHERIFLQARKSLVWSVGEPK